MVKLIPLFSLIAAMIFCMSLRGYQLSQADLQWQRLLAEHQHQLDQIRRAIVSFETFNGKRFSSQFSLTEGYQSVVIGRDQVLISAPPWLLKHRQIELAVIGDHSGKVLHKLFRPRFEQHLWLQAKSIRLDFNPSTIRGELRFEEYFLELSHD